MLVSASPSFDHAALRELSACISAEGGVAVADLQATLEELFRRTRSKTDLNDYRLARKPWKKLADEVTPVLCWLRSRGIRTGRVRFPLDDHRPDCWLWSEGSEEPVAIEVTIAQAKQRHALAKEMIATGLGRGFIAADEDASQVELDEALSKPRIAYSTEQALSVVKHSIALRLSGKNRATYAGFTLLIQAPLLLLPNERWKAIHADLMEAAEALPFSEVHIVSNADGRPSSFEIK
jgi:hypothetical protein